MIYQFNMRKYGNSGYFRYYAIPLHRTLHKIKDLSNNNPQSLSLDKSISRAKSTIRDLALSNEFNYFGTMTFDKELVDRFNINDICDLLKTTFKAYRRKYKDFKYLYILEKHKNGAYHLHGLFDGFGDLYINKYGYLNSIFFQEKLGKVNSFSVVKHKGKIANYITKYITKDCIRSPTRQLYFCSKGLQRSEVFKCVYVENFVDKLKYVNDYCLLYDFYKGDNKNV